MTEIVEDVPAVMISFDHQIAEGRIIRFSTGIGRDATRYEFDALLDKLLSVADRQEAKYRLEKIEHQLQIEEKLYVQQQEDLARLDGEAQQTWANAGRRSEWTPDKLTGAQRKDRENAELSLSRRRDMIKSLRSDQAKVKAMVHHAADGAANSH